MPPPEVELRFDGFVTTGTNEFAQLTLTNGGKTDAFVFGTPWRADIETLTGRTNISEHLVSLGGPVINGLDHRFQVPIPPGTTQWQASVSCDYSKRRDIGMTLSGILYHAGFYSSVPTGLADFVGGCLNRISGYANVPFQVNTALLTNLPPSRSSPP